MEKGRENFEQVVVIPGSAQALILDAHLGGRLLLEGIEGDMAQERKVLRAIALA